MYVQKEIGRKRDVVLGNYPAQEDNNNNLTMVAYRKKAPQESLSLVKNIIQTTCYGSEITGSGFRLLAESRPEPAFSVTKIM
jgi:hypothetical protein